MHVREVPFVIVQEKGPSATDAYDDIVIPIDYSDVTKQKLTIAASIATHFNSKVHIFAAIESDQFLQTKLDRLKGQSSDKNIVEYPPEGHRCRCGQRLGHGDFLHCYSFSSVSHYVVETK